MKNALGWTIAIVCMICAPTLIVLSFFLPTHASPGGVRINAAQFLVPILFSWLALFPRSVQEWKNLRTGHPIAQRFFGGRPAGFFGDYRRKLTIVGKVLLYGTITTFLICLYMGAVHMELFIIGFLFLVAFSSWIIRLEMNGDNSAGVIRRIGSALVYN